MTTENLKITHAGGYVPPVCEVLEMDACHPLMGSFGIDDIHEEEEDWA